MTILRISRPPKSYASLNNFKIFIDDIHCGKISNDDVKEIDVEDGNHSVYIKTGSLKSDKIEFTTKDNELVELTCGIQVKNLEMILLSIVIFTAYYILLSVKWSIFVKMTLLILPLLYSRKMKQLFIKFTYDM
ncbi:MAG: hypothetical protein VB018_14340 [Lachnospiraceae bacterium]|nr:hypothetical protein [Lachnospiraceae bacterium]